VKQQLSQIEKSVTHLLIATKQLLETLTQWSRHTSTETEVSDVYVRLGYEFNIACRAFTSIGVDVSDLGNVPDLLRQILEETLSQEASQQSLDRYLPRIRDIIINLLHGLKRKQAKLRARQNKDTQGAPPPPRTMSTTSTLSNSSADTGLTQMLEGVATSAPTSMKSIPSARRIGSGGLEESDVLARNSSSSHNHSMSREEQSQNGDSPARPSTRERKQPPPSLSDSSISTGTMQSIPVLTPDEYKLPIQRMSIIQDHPPPPPPPKQSDALLALQRGGELERRASRRYSAYQISKHLGASPGNVPMIPAQNSPIPNRGRDVRESLNAVRTRSSMLLSRQKSQRLRESPSRGTAISQRISEEPEKPKIDTKAQPITLDDSPLAKTPEDKLGDSYIDSAGNSKPAVGATLRGPPADEFSRFGESSEETTESDIAEKSSVIHNRQDSADEQFIPEQSPQPGKELTLFLQYKSKIKKFVLPDGSNDLSMARLQLAFIEKFAWNTQNNGVDLPEIYIQDQISGVRHELEDLSDIKDRSVLVLNFEALDEVKRHFDDGLGNLRKVVEGIRTAVDSQKLAMEQVSTQQEAAAKEMARLAALPPTIRSPNNQTNGIKYNNSIGSTEEIQALRRDLAVIRQSFTSFSSGITSSMTAIRNKAENVKAKAIDAAIPVLEGDSGRAYVDAGKKRLGDDSETIVNRVDDLQDVVEDLRKDVVTRGVRPLPRQLEQVGKDISMATKELKKMQDYVKKEKPIWTKIWEKELETVCNEREFLTLQEELITDLEDDLDKASQTFALVEQATKQQNVQATNGQPVTLRSTSRNLPNPDSDVDPMKAKDGVLGEVRALQPNHETRLEAIERAEKARQRELESRRENAAFKKELGNFVEEGKLRKSGGIEEAERQRKAKDERALRDEWEAQQARKVARAKARAEEKARQEQMQQAAIADGTEEQTLEVDELANGTSDVPPTPPAKDNIINGDLDVRNGSRGSNEDMGMQL
jgi:hypothetical protein